MADQLFPTSVVGSFAVPEWLANVKTDFFQRRVSRSVLDEIHLAALKAAVKDQELSYIHDITGTVTDANLLGYTLERRRIGAASWTQFGQGYLGVTSGAAAAAIFEA